MVPVQTSKLLGLSGKAEIPGVVESMSCISSVCKLRATVSEHCGERRRVHRGAFYRLVTL